MVIPYGTAAIPRKLVTETRLQLGNALAHLRAPQTLDLKGQNHD